MSNLSNQQINSSFNGLLQVPGGITSSLKTVQDGNGNSTGLMLSSTGSNVTTSSTFIASNNSVSFPNAVGRLISDGFGDYISVKDFGAVGDNSTDDTAAIQNAVNACSIGGKLFFPQGKYKITAAITINKPILICGVGPGSFVNDLGSFVRQATPAENAFTLVATLANFAFGAYGIIDVHFRDIAIIGNSSSSYSNYGVGTDTTVNSGDYHIRECSFTNVNIRYFTAGVNFTGIAYLNDFFNCCISRCTDGLVVAKGNASDVGGQTRLFGTTLDLNTGTCIKWLVNNYSGDLSLYGCTLADSAYGIISNATSTLFISGCSFEALSTSAIYFDINNPSNPSSDGTKTIIGNKFYNNPISIWINKTTTAFQVSNFSWPARIDGNAFLDAIALKIDVPATHSPFIMQNFVFGSSNSGTSNGFVATSQVSSNFAGRDLRYEQITKRIVFNSTTNTFTLPIGTVITSARMYLTSNSGSFTSLNIGDSSVSNRYISGINGQTQALNTWVNWTPPVPEYIVSSGLEALGTISGTAGLAGINGVFEIQGYIVP